MLLFLNMSGGEMILIFLVFLMLFGSKNIPDVARSLGKAMRQFKDATQDIQRDIESGARDFRTRMEKETKVLHNPLDEDFLAGNPSPKTEGPPKDKSEAGESRG